MLIFSKENCQNKPSNLHMIELSDLTQEQVSNSCDVLNRNLKAIEKHFGIVLRISENEVSLNASDTATQTDLPAQDTPG